MIAATRIDARLIHGQVANLWTNALNITRIMVVDGKAAESDTDKQILKLACPAGTRLSVLPVERAATNILEGRYDSQRLLVLVRDPHALVGLAKAGVDLGEVIVGNIARPQPAVQVTRSVAVNDADVADFEELEGLGVRLVSRMVPQDKAEDFMTLLRKA
ncbi:MAG: PTS sugar transporter subunit IIB [Atopobiaceae bacterium]|jgi:PTS system mannose-specific IIB component|nr:PTS sugar transporter subunit IIB [Atopobiaceae bacterium]MCH4179852.1 PTS sugar transporter subunit IIB [Atopobiaceae bacterium]MCH4213603.1 PTS sugar transporter subunit IIB [Atopobiaceae bacterium]MCH4229608.1 PTS sugar transporter subunit IIB [Atopobiaceae bacterium]MCH4276251.1 PTS sugar transporter subunit IIB [Atopobiaceae bacterium]